MADYIAAFRLFNRDVRLFLLTSAFIGLGFFGIYSLLLNLYLLRLGFDSRAIGLVNGIGPLALAIASLPVGRISRRMGSRNALIISFWAVMICLAAVPLGELLPSHLLQGWVMGSYGLAWLFASFFMTNSAPFLMGRTTPTERNHAFAVQGALLPVAGFAGNLLGGLLPSLFASLFSLPAEGPAPYRYALLCGAALYAAAALAMHQTRDRKEAERTVSGQGDAPPPYLLIGMIGLVAMLRTSGEWTMRLFFNIYLDQVFQTPTPLIGGLLAMGQLMGLGALVAPEAVRRWGKERVIVWACVGMACAFAPLIFIAHWSAVGVGFIGMIGMTSLSAPIYLVFSQEQVPPHWRTTIAGTIATSFGLGAALVGFGGGALVEASGFASVFIAGAAACALAAAIFWGYFRVPGSRSLAHAVVPEAKS